ncbi:MAG: hypothetical protein GKS03_11060 [Alphaproteobacteria bacterium]|nr:hypothetical protein [Alphaproteobacteria bacterium]
MTIVVDVFESKTKATAAVKRYEGMERKAQAFGPDDKLVVNDYSEGGMDDLGSKKKEGIWIVVAT